MKKYSKYIVFSLFVLISFYLTEQTALLVRNQDPLMNSIKTTSISFNREPVDATISDNYIIPGMYGKRVNEIKSLMNMKKINVFDELFLVSDYLKPSISVNDNKDKIINQANPLKKSISLITEYNQDTIKYLTEHNIPISILTTTDTFDASSIQEQINNDQENYESLEKLLNKHKINTHICLINYISKTICQKNKQYLVEPYIILGSYNYLEVKNNIKSGSIILLKDNISISNLELLINYINSKNLKIITSSSLISEK